MAPWRTARTWTRTRRARRRPTRIPAFVSWCPLPGSEAYGTPGAVRPSSGALEARGDRRVTPPAILQGAHQLHEFRIAAQRVEVAVARVQRMARKPVVGCGAKPAHRVVRPFQHREGR